ncbi:ThuA domain-containing protein [Rhodohalobacter mucosus]|uniref:Crp/Fnr family transcriptional regulator n=1 Tax=Rhodohalobacter mucosus TaxID=2079485 RepID=A0A316TXZ7_9BACT|nr:ThuA domain-containing protein [Rhodohalobacter mucosus]PWN07584.1 Crp/Fnr family transcriptional regulator [Rhodohalobacter mucosus]
MTNDMLLNSNQLKSAAPWIVAPLLFAAATGCGGMKEKNQPTVDKSASGTHSLLVFSKTTGFRHESIEAGVEALQKLGRELNLSLTFTENSEYMGSDSLFNHDGILFLNTTGTLFNEQERSNLKRFIQSGRGFVGVHSAADTEYDWPWYEGLVGAYFDNHPNNPNVRQAAIMVSNENHPALQGLPERWERDDEWYNYRSFKEGLNILLKLDTDSYEGSDHPGNHPIAWYREYDGGRSFYTGLGHTEESFSDSLFLNHLTGGILYALGIDDSMDKNQ